MKPYYDSGGVMIYHGDCREVLPLLAAGSADLILTDPPYGMKWQSGARAEKWSPITGDDGTCDIRGILGLTLRVLKRYRHIYMFGPAAFDGFPIVSDCELIWDKGGIGMGDLSLPWGIQHERIGFGVYVPEPDNRRRGAGRLAARLRKGSILRYPRKDGKVSHHPTEKPVDLLRELIESSSCIGETVLDPLMGTGSTLIAAQLEGRRAIGIEIEERYCETAAKRLSQQALPPGAVS